MPKCPKCKKEIDHLRKFVTGEIEYRYDVDGCEIVAFYKDDDVFFDCPECGENLFKNDDAKFFEETRICAASDCDKAFVPKFKNQKFHSRTCEKRTYKRIERDGERKKRGITM